ncbi:DUF2007 domain-containing protein [Pelomonas cellulosilytica]|uniref:DUF2007 domain-containing protein n=1 Tax=Pelomonas cellulosilytica TaxID=2906762 RepID=A0ABS8XS02_9BURK|nr:DUF2007 domain-containing protein [Pelomonas sp. P8]MCE4555497.1 DUF2007 domain-containing protein [Pelomonas sp. P8]
MKTAYEAGSAIEAHMLVDLLKQEGIDAHIRGEALQGAVGEIPATGLVRLEVADADHPAARAVIERWERTQVEPTPRPEGARKSSTLRGMLIGLALGVGGTYAAYRAPASTEGIDYNGDGQLDEKWTTSPNGLMLKAEVDRNLDGKIDYVVHYDAKGRVASAEADDNFDGVFETRQWFKNGNVAVSESDTDGDLYPDLRTHYTHGVVDTVEFINPATGKPLRVEHYVMGVLKSAEVDSDGRGRLDVRLRYGKLGDVESHEPLER